MGNVEFIPIGYMTYNWINVIASIIIMGFAIWFSVSDEFDITTQNIWIPSVIAIALLCIFALLEFTNKKTLLEKIMKYGLPAIAVVALVVALVGALVGNRVGALVGNRVGALVLGLILILIILFKLIIPNITNITKLFIRYKTLLLIVTPFFVLFVQISIRFFQMKDISI
jgi:hypothetical protein